MEIPSPAVECMQSPIFLQRERIPGKCSIFHDARVKMKLVAMMKLQNWMLMKSRISAADISMKNCRHHRINPPQVTAADSFYNPEREVQIRVKNNKRGFFRANPLMHSHLSVSITVALMQHNIVILAASIGRFFSYLFVFLSTPEKVAKNLFVFLVIPRRFPSRADF